MNHPLRESSGALCSMARITDAGRRRTQGEEKVMLTKMTFAAAVVAVAAFLTPVSAAPVAPQSPPSVKPATTNSGLTQVHYRHRHWRHRHSAIAAWFATAICIGAMVIAFATATGIASAIGTERCRATARDAPWLLVPSSSRGRPLLASAGCFASNRCSGSSGHVVRPRQRMKAPQQQAWKKRRCRATGRSRRRWRQAPQRMPRP